MKVRVVYQTPQVRVDEIFTGKDAETVVGAMQKAVAAKLNFAMRLLVNSMSPLGFAQEVVKRYNEETKKSLPLPQSCLHFLQQGEQEGIVIFLEK